MIIGVPKEIKSSENRVSLTPANVLTLVKSGHQVLIEKSAGTGSGFEDTQYEKAGAVITTKEEVFGQSEMILKVKEPLQEEYFYIRPGQIIFTYFHFASSKTLTEAMVKGQAVCIAYETVEKEDKSLPLLTPMSEVAGRMAVQQGAIYLEKHHQGKGVLLGGVPGVRPANVIILGGGVVGTQAAKMAAGLGAKVTILDISIPRLRYLSDILPANVTTLVSSEYNIRELLPAADLVIGAVLIPGAKAPVLISRDMLQLMQPGTVLIDVAVDQGGCIETCHPTTHQNPTYIIDDIVHYCVANMPGAVPYTSTIALTNATFPYIQTIASQGWLKACQKHNDLRKGLSIANGKVFYQPVAETFGLEYFSPDPLFS